MTGTNLLEELGRLLGDAHPAVQRARNELKKARAEAFEQALRALDGVSPQPEANHQYRRGYCDALRWSITAIQALKKGQP